MATLGCAPVSGPVLARALALSAAASARTAAAAGHASTAPPPPPPQSPLALRLLARFSKACALFYVVTHHVAFPSLVTGPSMFPSFASSGEVVLAECLPGVRERVKRGDVVICTRPVDSREHIVKRVAAVAGERVRVWPPPPGGGRGGVGKGLVYTGGAEVAIPRGAGGGASSSSWSAASAPELVVPPGHVWVQGDNMAVSRDSREYGPVPLGTVRGRVLCTLWPRPRMVDPEWGDGGVGGSGA
jgi:inner membrane protease subunit 1